MIYNAKIPYDIQRAKTRFNWLIENEKMFELTKKSPKRSLSQNGYLHLILGWFAIEYGDTIEYVKLEVFKKIVNPGIFKTEFINKKTGEIRESWRSSANLDTAEMKMAIDRFRNYASKEFGVYLPEPNEYEHLNSIEKEMKNYAEWL